MLIKGNFYKTDNDQTMLVVEETVDGYFWCIWHEQALEDLNRGMILFDKDGRHVFDKDGKYIEAPEGHIARPATDEEFSTIMEEINNL
jgi:hypothetical protein